MYAGWVREKRPIVAAVGLGVGLTLFVTLLPFLQFAYDNPQLHLALETAEGVIAAHLAFLVLGRFRTSGQLRHIALAWHSPSWERSTSSSGPSRSSLSAPVRPDWSPGWRRVCDSSPLPPCA